MPPRLWLSALLLVSLGSVASAAPPAVDIGYFRPPATAGGVLAVDSAYTPGHLQPSASLFFDYAHDPLTLRSHDNVVDEVVKHEVEMQAAISLSLWKRLELGVLLPVNLWQEGNVQLDGSVVPHHSVGDFRVDGKVHLGSVPIGVGRAIGFALALGVSFRTGSPKDSYQAGDITYRPRLLVTALLHPVDIHLEVGGVLHGTQTLDDIVIGQRLHIGLGARVKLVRGFGVLGTISSDIALSGTTGSLGTPAEFLLGLDYRFWKLPFQIVAAAGEGMTQAPGTADWRVVFALRYQPRPFLDRDHDGIPDEEDRCPYDKGLKENHGCPDVDTDGDGLLDRFDVCPAVRGPKENHGCPWPDADHDGVLDRDDRCPSVAGPAENHGCPDTDVDDDKVVDRLDPCPSVAGPVENHGCPWMDTDGDTVNDHDDRCPTVKGPKENGGCPVPDADGDGIPDSVDKCPNEKETFNGIEDDDGCPEKTKELAVLTDHSIEIKQQIFFAEGKWIIAAASYPLLAAVGAILEHHPEITRLRIEGHTDSKGKRDYNVRLSQSRADAVRMHLITVHHIDGDRLEAVGFGPDRPIADNATAAGRARNRRSAFILVAEPVRLPAPPAP